MNSKLKQFWKLALPYLQKDNHNRVGHTLRVLRNAEIIAHKEKADLKVVPLGALLHDLGKYKEKEEKRDHALISVDITKRLLPKLKISFPKAEQILYAIKVHSAFDSRKARTLEGQVLQDADKLDRFSPTKITEWFYNGKEKRRTIPKINQFILEKIIKTTTSFNTKNGKKIAQERFKLVRGFLQQIKEAQ